MYVDLAQVTLWWVDIVMAMVLGRKGQLKVKGYCAKREEEKEYMLDEKARSIKHIAM